MNVIDSSNLNQFEWLQNMLNAFKTNQLMCKKVDAKHCYHFYIFIDVTVNSVLFIYECHSRIENHISWSKLIWFGFSGGEQSKFLIFLKYAWSKTIISSISPSLLVGFNSNFRLHKPNNNGSLKFLILFYDQKFHFHKYK